MKKYLLLTFFLLVSAIVSFAQAERSDSAVVHFLEREYQVQFTDNNRLVFFKNGQEKFDDLFAAIRQARHTVHLEYFNFRNDSISRELFLLLGQKAKEGVKVRALFDGFGNASNNRPLRKEHLDTLHRMGIEIYEFDPLRFPWINHAFARDHRKIVVIDNVIAYTGGMNVADYYIKGTKFLGDWRDIHTRVEGDVVQQLQDIFLSIWKKTTKQELTMPVALSDSGQTANRFVGLKEDTCSSAGHKKIGIVNREPRKTPAIMRQTFLQAIDAAQRQIQIINPYFTLNSDLMKALKRAIKRGVDVQIMISDRSDIPITPRIVEHTAHRLMKAGAHIYFYEGGFHHSKIMMVDSLFTFVGSANLNSRSLRYDYECNLLVADAPTTEALQSIFNYDKQHRCFELTPQRWKQFSKGRRFQAWFFQFLRPFI